MPPTWGWKDDGHRSWTETGTPRSRSYANCTKCDELAAAGKTTEEIVAELKVSEATLFNWRQQAVWDTDATKERAELREQSNDQRLLADAELEKDALREVPKENS